MLARYFIKGYGSEERKEVTKREFIRAERSAGFRPKIPFGHPDYMKVKATGGFSGSNIDGSVEYIPLSDDEALEKYMGGLVGEVVELERKFDYISEVGSYAEPGMKMRVTKYEWTDDPQCVKIWFDQAEFLEENRAFETSDFFKRKDGVEVLVDAHEAGEYKPEDYYYLLIEDLDDLFAVIKIEERPGASVAP